MSIETQTSISEYLHASKRQFEQIKNSSYDTDKIHFVMGNESADLDSIVSSIAYAYFLNSKSISDSKNFYYPLINIPRSEIKLRRDLLYLFCLFNIDIDDLFFVDDNICLNRLFAENRLRLILVDHNFLKPSQRYLSDTIEEIVDHHADEAHFYPLCPKENKTIEVVGSNATFISERILTESTLSSEAAAFLLAPILLDTSNFEDVEKTTQKDVQYSVTLKSLMLTDFPSAYFQNLRDAKNDVTGFSASMIMSKDFKEYLDGNISYGISSLPLSVHWDIDALELMGDSIQKYAKDKKLDCLILLGYTDESATNRKLLVYSPSLDFLHAFNNYVQSDETLKLIIIPESFSEKFRTYEYRTTTLISRKQLQPMLKLTGISLDASTKELHNIIYANECDEDLEANVATNLQASITEFTAKGGTLLRLDEDAVPFQLEPGDVVFPACSGGNNRSQTLWAILRPYEGVISLQLPHATRYGFDPYNGRANWNRTHHFQVDDEFVLWAGFYKSKKFGWEIFNEWLLKDGASDAALAMMTKHYDLNYFNPSPSEGTRKVYITFAKNAHVHLHRLNQTNERLDNVVVAFYPLDDLISKPLPEWGVRPRSIATYTKFANLIEKYLDFSRL